MKNLETIFNVVVGTAGHIDHGKSSLVQKLTGIDPDRLPEEKSRGLTIDLGFAPLTLPDGRRVGIVDVPGHERLIKNMVAGATGIDLVLFVVAADDSVMPQTREHLTIMQILGIERGVIAITKIDMVEPDMIELVEEDIRETVAGTFLEDAPMQGVSSITGEGIEELKHTLFAAFEKLEPRETGGVFRMPIQRVFSPKGFGTVVTGIPLSGTVKIGDTLEILPLGQKGRVRGLQAYKESTDKACAGHSTAVNLSDVDYREIERGMVLAEPGFYRGSNMFEARLRYLPSSRKPLEHRAPIRLHTGTKESLGRVYLLEKKRIEPGEETMVQIRLEHPVVAAAGDRFVLRNYSPMETIGGGEIIDLSTRRLKTGKSFVIDRLRGMHEALGDKTRFLIGQLESDGYGTLNEKDLSVKCGRPLDEVRIDLASLVEDGTVREASRRGQYYSAAQFDAAQGEARKAAESFFREHPRRLLLEKSLLKKQLSCNDLYLQQLIEALSASGEVEVNAGGALRFRDHEPQLDANEQQMLSVISSELAENLFKPPSASDLAGRHGWRDEITQELFDLLVERGDVVHCGDGIYLLAKALEDAKSRIGEILKREGSITSADAKTLLDSTRKYTIPLLEYLDRIGFTVRKGDVRELKPGA